MIHHTIASNSDCGGHKYHVFATAEYPIFGSKSEYINTNIGIPLGPLSVDVRSLSTCIVPYQMSVSDPLCSSPVRSTSANARALQNDDIAKR